MQNVLSNSEPYAPSDDTIFFANYIRNETGNCALDIGTGSGYLAKILLRGFNFVVATDIALDSLRKAHSSIDNCICCSGANGLNTKFDLVVCNLPYLPSEKIRDTAVDGGKNGVEVGLEIIESVKNMIKKGGKFLFLVSSLTNYQELITKTEEFGFATKIIARKKIFFEELILVEAKK